MSKYAKCDNCGVKDDWNVGKGPFLHAGAVIQLRSDSGSENTEAELEICSGCKDELLNKFPKLKKVAEEGPDD